MQPTKLIEGACYQFKEAKAIADVAREISNAKPDVCECDAEQIKAFKKVLKLFLKM